MWLGIILVRCNLTMLTCMSDLFAKRGSNPRLSRVRGCTTKRASFENPDKLSVYHWIDKRLLTLYWSGYRAGACGINLGSFLITLP
jgi:hypothetical protein